MFPEPLFRKAFALLGILALSAAGRAVEHALECGHAHGLNYAVAGVINGLSYPPERQVDVLHLKLDVTPNFQERSVAGTATIKFKAMARPIEELKLHAVDLRVSTVESSRPLAGWQNTGQEILATFREPLKSGEEAELTIVYSAEPKRGLYFRTPEMGYKPGETHCYTQGEAIEARYWFPSYDHPTEKFTTEMICHVPTGMVALSNGRLLSEKENDGKKTFHWLQDKPHVNYLITLCAGNFEKLEEKHGDLSMAYWVPPSELPQANFSFKHTKPSMEFFEREVGMKYPWDRYDQVVVRDFQFGGMENTAQTTLTEYTLQPDDTEQLYVGNAQGLVAHELIHQWFGNLVTCQDWNHLWLNEGFATYYAHLYNAHVNGWDELIYGMNGTAESLLRGIDSRPIVSRKFENPDQLFRTVAHLVYGKAGWVLHMLREELGEELFRKGVGQYLEAHKFDVVNTEDLKRALEKASGSSLDYFFDQWVYKGGYPNLNVRYSWDERTKLARVSVEQTQQITPEAGLFSLPLKVRFGSGSEAFEKTLRVTAQSEDFYIPLPAAPKVVRFDPRAAILARINFEPTQQMLELMLQDKTDAMGRIIAVRKLGAKGGATAVRLLSKALAEDEFYGVRYEAVEALKGMRTPEALDALIAGSKQPDARVRFRALDGIGGFHDEKAFAHLAANLGEEKNPVILASLMESMAGFSKPEWTPKLAARVTQPSYRHAVASSAIQSLQIANATEELPMLIREMRASRGKFSSQALGEALHAVGQLGWAVENKDDARVFLLEFIDDPRDRVQLGAVRGLGALGDLKATPALEKLTVNSPPGRIGTQAETSLRQLRERQAPQAELGTVRSNILALQKENIALRKELEDLKKRFDATAGSPPAATKPPERETKPKRWFNGARR